jgi:hypothetical protein
MGVNVLECKKIYFIVLRHCGANLTIALVCIHICMIVLWSSEYKELCFIQSDCCYFFVDIILGCLKVGVHVIFWIMYVCIYADIIQVRVCHTYSDVGVMVAGMWSKESTKPVKDF